MSVNLFPLRRVIPHLVLLTVVGVVTGCRSNAGRELPQVTPVRLENHAPVIQSVILVADGKRLRAAKTGVRMEVRVFATDQDGDRLRYSFVSEPDTGLATSSGPTKAIWSPRGTDVSSRLRIRVSDPRGRTAERVLEAIAEPRLAFGGQVVDAAGKGINGVDVQVDGVLTRTDANGRFSLAIPDRSRKHFVIDLTHPNYGPVAQVLYEPVRSGRWTMATATVLPVNLAQPVVAQVTTGSCATIPSSRVNWALFPKQRQGVTANGSTAFLAKVSAELAAGLLWAETQTTCPAGFSMRASPGAFVRPGGGDPVASGQVTLTQIPAWGGASMPGDYTVRMANGQIRAMQSFGAATVKVTSNGEMLQLAGGQRATLHWPIDTMLVRKGSKPLSEIPLLRYDEMSAGWKEDGLARLDSSGAGWVANVDHLSTFNLDVLKVDQACVRLDTTGLPFTTLTLEVIVPVLPGAVVRTYTLDNSSEHLHALYNLPTNTDIVVRPFIDQTGTPEPHGTFVINTGAAQNPTDPNEPDAASGYAACQVEAALIDLGPNTTITRVDNDPMSSGMLVPVYVGLIDTASGDLYPSGAGGFPVVGIFDNGSTSIYVSDVVPNGFSNGGPSDAAQLGVTHGLNVTVRVSPVSSSATASGAPMGDPLGGSDPADAEVQSIKIRVTTTSAVPPDLTLLGGPFAVAHLAWINYTEAVQIPGAPPGEFGANSRFAPSPEVGFPVAQVTLPMTRFGTTSSAGTATVDKRFLISGVTFFHTKGGTTRAVGHAVPGSTDQIWYDVGSRWTAVAPETVAALGLTDTDIIGDCFDAGRGRLYRISRVEFVGVGGRYVVTDAMVCEDNLSMVIAAGGRPTIAMIGSNLFRHVGLLVNGPADTFGVYAP